MANEIVLIGFYILTLIYSVIIHEVAHGVMALWLGDMTAKYADRLNLNPLKHIDPFGSVILPALLIIFKTGFVFGWAKPVPYNPYNLRDQKWGPTMVALAGPASNFLLAFIAGLIAKLLPISLAAKDDILLQLKNFVLQRGDFADALHYLTLSLSGSLLKIFFVLLLFIIFWNVILGCFNLLPIPPLDGSKLLYALVPLRERTKFFLEQYGIFVLFFIILFIPVIFKPISYFVGSVLNIFFNFTL